MTQKNGVTGFRVGGEWVFPDLDPGDAILMRGDKVHRGGRNRCAKARDLVFCVFDATPAFRVLPGLGCYHPTAHSTIDLNKSSATG